jgi:hypothetical protein
MGLVLGAGMMLAACGGATPATSGGGSGSATPGASSGGGGAVPGGAITGKRMCEIVTLDQATSILGEAPPRGEASDDRLSKSHTCAYKPGPKLILQVQVRDEIADEAAFDAALDAAINPSLERTPVEGVGDKAYFIARTEPPAGMRLYILAKGKMILVNIGREDLPADALQETARGLAPQIIDAL